jgi:phage terminase large subunit
MFTRTTAINKLLSLKKRKKIIQGGTWAGKTYGIMAIIIDFAAKTPQRTITVVAETIPAIKRGALKDFKEIMMLTNRWVEANYNATDRTYRYANSTIIEFNSFDSIGKAQAAGKRTDLFINEAPYIAFEIADALMGRTSGNIWIDFNPTFEFWAHTEIMNSDDADFIILKYIDNEALPKTILKELLLKQEKAKTSQYWANWCRVYIDGEIGNLEGAVYQNWQLVDFIPIEARLLGIGLDFGYTNDPTAAIGIYLLDDKIYIDEIIYQTGLLNSQIATLLQPYHCLIIADSAEPKSIDELRARGLNIVPAEKGNGSILFGIQIINEKSFFVTSKSNNVLKELRGYIYEKDRSGKVTNNPISFFNHAMDAMRYAFVRFFKPRVQFKGHKIL